MKSQRWILAGMLICCLAGCAEGQPTTPTPTATPEPSSTPTGTAAPSAAPNIQAPGEPEALRPEIVAVYPHDVNAFTEGLALDGDHLYESTGQYGQSTLREVDLKTGKVLRSVSLDASLFGEGLTVDGDRLIQLTWREKTAIFYDKATFIEKGRRNFAGEGWGLCFDGQKLYMSNGTSTVTVRAPETFHADASITVTESGDPVDMINELECVGDLLYANEWHTNHILRIDKASGRVTGIIDASGLLTPTELAAAGSEGVLNGIAYDPRSGDFLITGKRWPKLFEVRFVTAAP